jgi:hypothetical protein
MWDTKGRATWMQQLVHVRVIGAVRNLCIFLPKFHCELAFIEFFWGMVKKCLRENCDYNFDTLKENLPKGPRSDDSTLGALHAQVDGHIPRGMETQQAQLHVRAFSLQLIAVPKARIGNLLFWDIFKEFPVSQ